MIVQGSVSFYFILLCSLISWAFPRSFLQRTSRRCVFVPSCSGGVQFSLLDAACWFLSPTACSSRIHNANTKQTVPFKFKFAKCSISCGINTETISVTQALFERWARADYSWVFVMVEGTSICWCISGHSSLLCQESKLWHKMHYLAPVCQPPCLCV